MIKTHLTYLRRIVGFAASMKGGGNFMTMVNHLHGASSPEYQMMKDIVCDSRFYSVIGDDDFWKAYSIAEIRQFMDSLSSGEWADEKRRTELKEDFLNDWMARHLFPLSDSEKARIESEINPEEKQEKDEDEVTPEMMEFFSPNAEISDLTESHSTSFKPNQFQSDELKDYAIAAKNQHGGGASDQAHTAEAKFLRRIHPSILDLAVKIGRRGGSISFTAKGKFQSASRSDISGVTTGNNLNSLLPSELALLATRGTENIFYQKFAEKRLQIFSSASRSTEQQEDKSGPIYICIDTSGSMTGEPETLAKTLALAIAIVAQKDKRPVCLINYSFDVSFFVLTNLIRQRKRLLHFLSYSYSGGNNENALFDFIFNHLPQDSKYRPFKQKFKNADMLVISDFQWGPLHPEMTRQLTAAQAKGMRIYTLQVNDNTYDLPDDLLTSGPNFIKSATESFTYNSVTETIEPD